MNRWIASKKTGQLISKKHVMQLLEELIRDSIFWLEIQLLPKEDREFELSLLTPTERYWYEDLFPAWINEKDPKKVIWKKKLMAGIFEGSDISLIDQVCQIIESSGGDTFNSYIADLSMATDIIVSGLQQIPLSIQLTSVRNELAQTKQQDWLRTLQYWGIKRGIFISFNPMLHQVELRIGQEAFQHSDHISKNCYLKIDIDR
ncbi:hypothetical protein [Nostoc sp. CCY0012]|uniref:hypothetical protein n=1 Tax=Nostoc sp. CCY0012 TaxID=1056123 RepID=UPI0039C62180